MLVSPRCHGNPSKTFTTSFTFILLPESELNRSTISGFVLKEIIAMCVVVGPISSLLTILLRKRFVRSQFVLPMLFEESTIKATSAALLQSGTEKRIQTKVGSQKVMSFCVGYRHFLIFFNVTTPFFSLRKQFCSSQPGCQSVNQSINKKSVNQTLNKRTNKLINHCQE